jgi:subtilisin family serine protease
MITSVKSADVDPLALVGLPRLMALTRGQRSMKVGLIDGPVRGTHPDFAGARLEFLHTQDVSHAAQNDAACLHATSVAGILVARRGSVAPAICPDATLLIRPIFSLASHPAGAVAPDELASAIVETVDAGARILNLSLALAPTTATAGRQLQEALNYAFYGGLIVVAAAGNQGTIGSSVITRHPSVIPVVAYDLQAHPALGSNLGHSIGQRGVGAPGEGVTSLGADGGSRRFGGTSAAAAIVTGAIALLWSEFPGAAGVDLRYAVTKSTSRRVSVIPPLLNAWAAFEMLRTTSTKLRRLHNGP